MVASGHQPLVAGALGLVERNAVPWLTVAQLREVDRLMIEEFQISLVRMMENAGSCLAELARWLLGGDDAGRAVVVLAGPGGNGGGGLVAARHLTNALAEVEVGLATSPEEFSPAAHEQLQILEQMRVLTTHREPRAAKPDLVIDALLGYSQEGDPRGGIAKSHRVDRCPGRVGTRHALGSGARHRRGPSSRGRRKGHHDAGAAKAWAALRRRGHGRGRALPGRHLGPHPVYKRLGVDYRSPFAAGRIVRIKPSGTRTTLGTSS